MVVPDSGGETLLHYSAFHGQAKILEWLLDRIRQTDDADVGEFMRVTCVGDIGALWESDISALWEGDIGALWEGDIGVLWEGDIGALWESDIGALWEGDIGALWEGDISVLWGACGYSEITIYGEILLPILFMFK